MTQRTKGFIIVGAFVALVLLVWFEPSLLEDPSMEMAAIAAEKTAEKPAEEVPDLQNKKAWRCEDVTVESDGARCGIVHVCRNLRDKNVMAEEISLHWNKMPAYRIWGPAGKTHQSLRMLESTVWTPPLPGGKMECGVARDTDGRLGIAFLIYHEDNRDSDFPNALSFFPYPPLPAPAVSTRPLRRISY